MAAKPIPAIWVKDRSPKDRKDIEYILRNNSVLINALLDILNQMEQEEYRAERSPEQYDSANWSHKQADRNGAIRALHKIKSLFNYLES